MPKIALGFTGCKVNSYEIQALSEAMESLGMEIVPFTNRADCYIINTCSVTSKADLSSRNLIRKARRLAPKAKIAVTGCYAQLNPKELSEVGIDLLVPNCEKEEIPLRIADLIAGVSGAGMNDGAIEFGSFTISRMRGLTRAFVKIQDGCDRRCTYCTIWKSRGEVRSRNSKFIIDEINKLHNNGYLEAVLTGVHIGRYDFGTLRLPKLLRIILENTDIPRIRLSSMYPTELDDDFFEILTEKRICPHVHISIQSGDDRVLQRMGRDYSSENLKYAINLMNKRIPGITIGADIITGFPGETDLQFRNSYNLIANYGIHHLHVFSFSARPGTKAAKMSNRIDAKIAKDRTERLRNLGNKKLTDHKKSFINKELQVLFENRTRDKSGTVTGLSENYLRVEALGNSDLKGKIIKVRPYTLQNSVLIARVEGE